MALMEWAADAACVGMDTEKFYSDPPAIEALFVCAACPVRVQCDDYADRRGDVYGVWGARTGYQRLLRGMKQADDPAYDHVVVERLVAGQSVKSMFADRREAVKRLASAGYSEDEITRRTGVHPRQQYRDLRSTHANAA